MRSVYTILALWIVIINIFALVAANRMNTTSDTSYTWMREYPPLEHSWNPADQHVYWDSGWYLDIAKNGYQYPNPAEDTLSNVAFLPIYPALIAIFGSVLFGHYVLAGWLITITALAGAVYMMARLIRQFHPGADYLFAIFAMLIFPTAYFFNALYTESLFLFFSVSSFYFALKKRFALAGLFGFLASLTRITGILLVIPLAWEYGREHGFRLGAFFRPAFLPALFPAIGTFLFFLFHYIAYGDFFLFFKIQSAWGRSFSINSEHVVFFSHPAVINFALDVSFALFGIVATIAAWRFLRTSYALYMGATIAAAIGTGTIMSVGRYILVLFPIFILAGLIKNTHVKYAWILISTLLLALYTLLFSIGYWAG